MDEVKAREILGDTIQDKEGALENIGIPRGYVYWEPTRDEVTLDGEFKLDELEAIAWWMRNKRLKKKITITLPEPNPGMPGIRVDRNEPGITIIHSDLEVVIKPEEPIRKEVGK